MTGRLLRVQVDDGSELEYTPTDSPIEIGRGLERGISLSDPLVSRRHARLVFERGWVLEDTGSRNGVWYDGRRVERAPVDGVVHVGLGDASEGARLRLSVHELSPGDRTPRDEAAVRPDPRPRVLTIGRDSSCDVALRDPMVSWHHARLRADGDVLWVEDLGSSNDTLVNGASVQRHQLREGDRLLIGNTHLVYDRGRVIPSRGRGSWSSTPRSPFAADDASSTT